MDPDEEDPRLGSNKGVTFNQEVAVSKFDPDISSINPSKLDQPRPKSRRKSSILLNHDLKKSFSNLQDQLEGQTNEFQTEVKAGRVLQMIQDKNFFQHSLPIEEKDEQQDPLKQMQNAHLFLIQNNKPTEWEEEEAPTEEYLAEKEKKRLAKLKLERGACLTKSFSVIFHLGVIINFLISLIDSFKLIIEQSRFQALLLKGDYNCLEVVGTAGWIEHTVNILHCLMSACVLYTDNKHNAGLCMAYVFSQALHTSYKAFQFFMHSRFDEGHHIYDKIGELFFIICVDMLTSVVVIQRFYDLTDRVRYRAQRFSSKVADKMSMNDDIIYLNQSSFLQRKHILREAIASQVYSVIKKIGNYRKKGLEPDHVALYRELHAAKAALQDVDKVENINLFKELKKANGKRLKEFDADPIRLQRESVVNGSMSKLFLIEFKDRLK